MAKSVSSTTSKDAFYSLVQQACQQVAIEERDLCQAFLERILADMHDTPTLSPATWRTPQSLLAIFRLFQCSPGGREEVIKVQVEPLLTQPTEAEESSTSIHDGTQITIHLPDTPFILGTLRNYLKRSGLTLYSQVHSTFTVSRQEDGLLSQILKETTIAHHHREMMVVIVTEAISDTDALETCRGDLVAVLTSVKRSVDDFSLMATCLSQEVDLLEEEGCSEESRFLRWTYDDNFVFMGMRFLNYKDKKLDYDDSSDALGVFRQPNANDLLDRIMPGMRDEIDTILKKCVESDHVPPLSVEYCQHGKSIIYASEGVDFFIIDRAGKQKESRELVLVLGRFSRTALASRASTVPVLNRRMQTSLALSGYAQGSYLYHEFRSLYDRMPLRELFYSTPEILTQQICAILQLQGDTDFRVSARLGRHGNYISVLMVFSRNRYRAKLEEDVAQRLSEKLPYPVSSINVSETDTLFFVVCYANHDPGEELYFEVESVGKKLQRLIMTWEDKLRQTLFETLPQRLAHERFSHYVHAFDTIFKEATLPSQAAQDSAVIATLKDSTFSSRIIRHPTGRTYIKLYSQSSVPLTQMVQTFHNFGITCLHELSSTVRTPDGQQIVIQRFEVGGLVEELLQLQEMADYLSEALFAIRMGRLQDDPLNRLVLLQGFHSREIALIRSLRQYLLQINPELSAFHVNRVLIAHNGLARLILKTFLLKFDPNNRPSKKSELLLKKETEQALLGVPNLQDDQVLRRLFNVVSACVRTNFFQRKYPTAFAFKIDCSLIQKMPSPRPWRAIFVHTPHMEGIHLSGGAVARGGLRYSDRIEDYRTEVLGLMKTQMVKNAIIVPVGAKGGFVIQNLETIPQDQHKAWLAEHYQAFIRALLDITDNRVEGNIVHPPLTVIHDDPDPYLVVAADKGTATFSDLANQVAQEAYHFWLGDAFASGGSYGYDHKKVGITARGAWESIRIHFEEMGRDIHQEPFSVVGIGDMAGDVFGNGLLASKQICLLGAFNHRHIFLDPQPDPEGSYKERKRLFDLPRSSWSDYNSDLISEGGGVFERSAKSIPLNPVLRKLLDTKAENLSGEEVIRHLLRAKVDLLYNGGIGTYIKASDESQLSVSDKNNDSVRVNGSEVKALVIGEGGNLGITQRGRLEIASQCPRREGGRINTDALDNSGGVDLSDHEVNLKILFSHLLTIGEIASLEERNQLLADLTDEVAESVLLNNRLQHQAVSRDQMLSKSHAGIYLTGLQLLQSEAGLNFKEECVPNQEVLDGWIKGGCGLPRPLLAIMLGYAKLYVNQQLLDSDVVDLLFFERHLADYFPVSISRTYHAHLSSHFLKREIIATNITNRLLNQTGTGPFMAAFSKVRHLRAEYDPLPSLVKAYLIVENLVDAPDYRKQVHGLKNRVASQVKYKVLGEMESVLLHLATWMVTHLDPDRISIDLINLYGRIIQAFRSNLWAFLPQLLSASRCQQLEKQKKQLMDTGLSEQLATETVLLPFLKDTMTILHIKEALHTRFESVAHLYIQVDDFFGLSWVEHMLEECHTHNRWGRMNLENVRKELLDTRSHLVRSIMTFKRQNELVAEAFEHYRQEIAEEEADYQAMLQQMKKEGGADSLALSVLVRKFRDLLLHNRRSDL